MQMDRAHDERSEIFLQMLHLFAVIFATQTARKGRLRRDIPA